MVRIALQILSLVGCFFVASTALADTAYHYTVKGVIKGMPGNGLASNEILVKHEAIPGYRDDNGTIVGMMAMTMPFYLAEGLSLGGIKEGDTIEMKVEQHLRPKFTEEVTSITKVP
jgi:Cu/Ag efflux protein CusF